jgi:glycosyltransferase involved in cell wall biosynthesis
MTQVSPRPKILIIPSSYFASGRTVGGGERYATEYGRALARLTPVTLGLFDRVPAERVEDGLTIHHFSVRHFSQRRMFPITVQTWAALNAYDIIHVMVFPTPLADLILLRSRFCRQKIVLTDVGGGGPCWSTYLRRISPNLDLNRFADGLALLSNHSASFFAQWDQPKVILYGGIDLKKFVLSTSAAADYALFVGRLLPHKGILEVIEALPRRIPLRVVGRPYDQGYFKKLQQAAHGKEVRFFTEADDAELKAHMEGAALVLQPSLPADPGTEDKSELLGLVALEAMASGKPVIVTRAGSLPELVEDGESGFVIPARNPEALRTKIELLMSDPPLRLRMGLAARKRVEGLFTWDKAAERGLEFYQTLLDR